jgi:hypothetical protein
MPDKRKERREQLRVELAEMKNAVLAELEGRGYEVRGKTPAQIRLMLKKRPLKRKPTGQ